MHSLLESYLSEVTNGLGSLPTARRNEEIKEIRQHLRNAVIVNREMGQTEDEAAVSAVEQFGRPEETADQLTWAWRRERSRDRRQFWGAALCSPALIIAATPLLFPIDYPHEVRALQLHSPGAWGMKVCSALLWGTPPYLLAGGVCGLAFPKRAVAGVSLATAALLLCAIVLLIPTDIGDISARSAPLASLVWMSVSAHLPFCCADLVAVTVAAWAGSRWREKWKRVARA